MRWRDVVYVLVLLFLILIFAWSVADVACAMSTDQAVYEMLREFGSPLADESYTVVAFWRAHPEFSIVDFYAVLWAESSLGKGAMRHHNVGSIIGGKVGTVWRDLRTGTFGSRSYNEYATFRDGQRAALRLTLERYGGSVIASGLHRYYGYNVPGWGHYSGNVYAARSRIVAEGRERGFAW